MEEQKNFFDLLNKKQALIMGVVGGILILCTIGFFILLALVLNRGVSAPNGSKTDTTLAPEKFSQCLDSGKYASVIQADEQLGVSLGVQGTPATFINGYLISGAYPYEAVKSVIDALLAGKIPTWDTAQYGELAKVDMPDLGAVDWKGDESAKVTVVEFADFECPYCVRFNSTMKQVFANYGDKIRYTFKHFPLSFHQNAQKAAEAYECAKEQGKAYEMYDKLFTLSGSSQLSVDNYKKAASELGLK